jgi:hypothetical protein
MGFGQGQGSTANPAMLWLEFALLVNDAEQGRLCHVFDEIFAGAVS